MNRSNSTRNYPVYLLSGVIALLLLCIGFIIGRLSSPGTELTDSEKTAIPAPSGIPTEMPAAEAVSVHTHAWAAATCLRARTCTTCGATEGEALGHSWTPASCSFPRTCNICGETEGQALGHTWIPATTTTPKMCSVCGMAEGEPINTFHTPDRPVDLYSENELYSKVNSVAVAHSQSKSACETCVYRLREAGYNAFLYEQAAKSGYSIQIGVFDDRQDAKDFAEYLHNQPEVKGVSLSSAYVTTKTRLPGVAIELYGTPWW